MVPLFPFGPATNLFETSGCSIWLLVDLQPVGPDIMSAKYWQQPYNYECLKSLWLLPRRFYRHCLPVSTEIRQRRCRSIRSTTLTHMFILGRIDASAGPCHGRRYNQACPLCSPQIPHPPQLMATEHPDLSVTLSGAKLARRSCQQCKLRKRRCTREQPECRLCIKCVFKPPDHCYDRQKALTCL